MEIKSAENLLRIMENPSFERVLSVFEELAKSLEIINGLAQIGLRSVEYDVCRPEEIEEESAEDPSDRLLKPSEIPGIVGFSFRTFSDRWVPKYGIKSSGSGKGRRFKMSEVVRAINAYTEESREQNGVHFQDRRPMGD